MKEKLKEIIKHTPLLCPLNNYLIKRKQARKIKKWKKRGCPMPPPHIIKQQTLRSYAQRYNLKVLVETGTYKGDMVEAMKGFFERICSIELSQELFDKAKKRFESERHIELIHGDSGKELEKLMKMIDKPALFWLDGHYSEGVTAKGEKDTPVYEELSHILNARDLRHVIIIDDARCFGQDAGYPTLEELKDFIRSKRDNMEVTVTDDSIRITPKL